MAFGKGSFHPMNDPKIREIVSQKIKEKWQDPEYRDKVCKTKGQVIKALKRRWNDPIQREKFANKIKEKWSDPEYKKKVGEKISKGKSWNLFTKEELEDLYLNQKKSSDEIAKERGCSKGSVLDYLKKYGIKRRTVYDYIPKLRKAFLRENNPLWKDGKTKVDKLLRECAKYEFWRQSVFEKDNFTCQKCGQKGGDLVAHHKKPFSKLLDEVKKNLPLFGLYEGALIYTPLWDVDNGITLCLKCHKKIHKIGGKKK